VAAQDGYYHRQWRDLHGFQIKYISPSLPIKKLTHSSRKVNLTRIVLDCQALTLKYCTLHFSGSRRDYLISANGNTPSFLSDMRDSVTGIATGYGLDDRGVGVRVPVGSRIFSSPSRPDRLWPSPIQWVPWALSPGVKRPGLESHHSPPTSTEFKKI
jgi:hypothetical protein